MGVATLRFKTEGGSDARRVIEDLAAAYVEAQKRVGRAARESGEAVAKSARASGQRVVRETTESVGRQVGTYRGARVQIEREEQLVTRAKLRELALQGAAQKTFLERYTAALKLATTAMEAEVGKRGQLSERERRQVESVALAMVSAHEQAERRRTAATEREERKRRSVWGRRLEQGGRALGAAAQAGAQIAGQAHDARQQARGERASVDHTVNAALFQAGIRDDEAAQARAEVRGRAHALGMDPQVLAEGLFEAQKQFSVLSAPTREGRQAALRQQLDLAEFAQSTYQDPGEVMRVAGMLGQQGITGAAQRQTLLSMTGIANAGSVELSDIVSRGLGPLMQNVAIATGRLGPGATAAQRSSAVQEATLRTMAMQEVASRGGGNIRASMNAFAAMERAMVSPRTATNLRASLVHRGFTEAQIGTVLSRERDPRSGRTEDRFRSSDSLRTLSSLNTLFGGNTTELVNALSAGGHGMPTVLLSNVRTLASTLNSQTENGETVQQRVERMRREGSQFTEANVEQGRKMVQAEDGTKLERQRQDRQGALLDGNTAALNRLSDQMAGFQARNPITSAALPVLAGAAATVLGAKGVAVAGGALSMEAQSRAMREGRTVFGEEIGWGSRLARGATSLLGGPIGAAALTAHDAYSAAQGPRGLDALLDALPERLARTLRENPPQITLPPNATVHSEVTGTSGRQAGS